MTRRRQWVMLCLGVLVCLVGAWVVLPVRRDHNITPAAYGRIRQGMTRADVEGVLGASPGYYTPRLVQPARLVQGNPREWADDGIIIRVWFDDAERVERKEIGRWQGSGVTGAFRYWLGL